MFRIILSGSTHCGSYYYSSIRLKKCSLALVRPSPYSLRVRGHVVRRAGFRLLRSAEGLQMVRNHFSESKLSFTCPASWVIQRLIVRLYYIGIINTPKYTARPHRISPGTLGLTQ